MAPPKKRRRVVRFSTLEKIVLVAVIGIVAYCAWDIYKRYRPEPAVGGLASRVYAPNGAAPHAATASGQARPHAATAKPTPGLKSSDDPHAWQPTTYTPPSGSPAARPSGKVGKSTPKKAPPAEDVEVHFPTWSDADPSLASPKP